LKFNGWNSPRRVVMLRRALRHEMMIAQEDESGQLPGFIETDRKASSKDSDSGKFLG